MYERDYFKKQIDQFAMALTHLLSNLLKLKKEGKVNEYVQVINQTLKNERNLEIQQLIDIPMISFIDELKKKDFSNDSLDKLADVLFMLAEVKDETEKKELYKKCLLILDHLEKTEKDYSLDWNSKKKHHREIFILKK